MSEDKEKFIEELVGVPRVRLPSWTPEITFGEQTYEEQEGKNILPDSYNAEAYQKAQEIRIPRLASTLICSETHRVFKALIGQTLQNVEMMSLSDKQEKAFKSTFKRIVWNNFMLLSDMIDALKEESASDEKSSNPYYAPLN